MRAGYKAKGYGGPPVWKGIFQLLDMASKANYPDSPWVLLLARYGCHRDEEQVVAPCPCVWRRPETGAMAHGEVREQRWDWRSAVKEREVRLARQHRLVTPVQR